MVLRYPHFLLALPVCLLIVGTLCAVEPPDAQSLASNGVTAHRGSSGTLPENTLTAFRAALDQGCDWIEVDIYQTRDGKLVVIHDTTTGRTAEKNLTVAESTYAELSQIDVASRFRQQHGLSLEECPPERIPLLDEVVELVLTQRRTRLSIQPKTFCVDEAVALLRQRGALAWCGFNDGSLAKMRRAKELAPELVIFWDRPANCDLDHDIATAQKLGFEYLVLNDAGVTRERIAQIQMAGLRAGAWTVNNVDRLRTLHHWGIDRVYTDYPERLFQIQQEAAQVTDSLP